MQQRSFWKSVKETLCNNPIVNGFKKVWVYIKMGVVLASALAGVVTAFNLIRSYMGYGEEDIETNGVEANMVASGSYNTFKIPRAVKLPRIGLGQGSKPEEVAPLLESNTFFFKMTYALEPEEKLKEIHIRTLGIFGHTAIGTKHEMKTILQRMAEYENGNMHYFELTCFKYSRRELKVKLTGRDLVGAFKFQEKTEICFIEVPKRFEMFRDITGHIPTLEQHKNVGANVTCIYVAKGDKPTMVIHPCKISGQVSDMDIYLNNIPGLPNYREKSFDLYETNYQFQGLCGAIYMSNTQTPFFAYHVAGMQGKGGNYGYAAPLIREVLEAYKSKTIALAQFIPKIKTNRTPVMQMGGFSIPTMTIPKDEVPFMGDKTKIEPSLIQGKIEETPVITQPAILSKKDPRYIHDKSPLYYGCIKHVNYVPSPNKVHLEAITAALSRMFIQKCLPMRGMATELTMEEVVVGIDGYPGYEAMRLDTSSGWPFNLGEKKSKAAWIKVERDEHNKVLSVSIDPKLEEVIKLKKKMRQQGIKPFTVFLDWLKDERRKEEKLLKPGGTRIFSLSPVDFTYETRSMFLDFVASFQAYRLEIPSAVGIDTNSMEWTRLGRKLLEMSGNILTGDFSAFGDMIPAEIVLEVANVVNAWYSYYDPNHTSLKAKERYMMMLEHCNAQHLCHDLIYQVFVGSPSGSAITVIVNTISLIYLFILAWLDIMKDTQFGTVEAFFQHVRLFGYGDDSIAAVSKQVCEQFNCVTMAKFFKTLNMEFTDATKAGTEKYTTLSNSTFLKASFAHHPNRKNVLLAPLEKTSITDCAQWVWKSNDKKESTAEVAEASIRLAFGHGPKFFKEWMNKVNAALKEEGIPPVLLSWREIDEKNYGESEIEGEYQALPYDRKLKELRLTSNPELSWLTNVTMEDTPEGKIKMENLEPEYEVITEVRDYSDEKMAKELKIRNIMLDQYISIPA